MPMVSLRAERAKRRVIKARGICFKGTGGILTQARESVLAWVVNANVDACRLLQELFWPCLYAAEL